MAYNPLAYNDPASPAHNYLAQQQQAALMQRQQQQFSAAQAQQQFANNLATRDQGLQEQQFTAQQAQQVAAQKAAHEKEGAQWFASAYPRLKQDPSLIPQALAFAKQKGYLPPEVPDDLDMRHVDAIAMKLGIAPLDPKVEPGFSLSPGEVRFDSTGKRIASVAPRPVAATGGAGMGKAPSGYQWMPDGSMAPIPGGPADRSSQDRPDTEGTKRVKVLYGSLAGAEKQLATLKGVDTSSIANAAAGSNAATRLLQSADYRRYESAALRWAANLLYIKSGATAPAEEVQSTYKQFFPQPGDPPDLQAQKAEARAQEMAGIAETYGIPAPTSPSPAGPQRLTPEQAEKLPPGTKFVGMDGITRVKH